MKAVVGATPKIIYAFDELVLGNLVRGRARKLVHVGDETRNVEAGESALEMGRHMIRREIVSRLAGQQDEIGLHLLFTELFGHWDWGGPFVLRHWAPRREPSRHRPERDRCVAAKRRIPSPRRSHSPETG